MPSWRDMSIDRVIDVAFQKDGQRRYLVQWKNTWEREETLLDACHDLLENFWRGRYRESGSDRPLASKERHEGVSQGRMSDQLYQEDVSGSDCCDKLACDKDESLSSKHSCSVAGSRKDESEARDLLLTSDVVSEDVNSMVRCYNSSSAPVDVLSQSRRISGDLNVMGGKPESKDFSKELPDQYKNVGFAKSVREKYKDNLGKDIDNGFDYIEECIANRQARGKSDYVKRPRDEVVREYISFRNGTRVQCEICMETFADKKSLQRHKICRHDKFSPHQCPICHKMFVKPGDVRRHLVSHTDDRRHMCPTCNKSYKTRNHLRRHTKSKHPELFPSLGPDEDVDEEGDGKHSSTDEDRVGCLNSNSVDGLVNSDHLNRRDSVLRDSALLSAPAFMQHNLALHAGGLPSMHAGFLAAHAHVPVHFLLAGPQHLPSLQTAPS